jgi:hypothetical protein
MDGGYNGEISVEYTVDEIHGAVNPVLLVHGDIGPRSHSTRHKSQQKEHEAHSPGAVKGNTQDFG